MNQIADFGLKERIAAVCPFREGAEAGCLMTYAPNFIPMFRRCAHYVHRILTGTKPGDLPIEQPTVLELVINGKTARTLGLEIPPSLRVLADQLIE